MEICLKDCWLHLRFCCKVALFNSTNSKRKRKIIIRISQSDSKFLTAKCFCKKYKLQGLQRLEIEISVTPKTVFFFKFITFDSQTSDSIPNLHRGGSMPILQFASGTILTVFTPWALQK